MDIAWREHLQRPLEEADVQIGSAYHGSVPLPVSLSDSLVHGLQTYVGRVADHEVHPAAECYQIELRV